MNTEERNKQSRAYMQFRTIFNMCMGILYIGCGLLVIFAKRLGFNFYVPISMAFLMSLGGLLILYGLFRIYRGFRHVL